MATSRGKLRPIKPRNYEIAVFDIDFAAPWRYSASVTIESEVLCCINEFSLHTQELEIVDIFCTGENQARTSVKRLENAPGNTDTISRFQAFPALTPGKVWIHVDYRGSIGNAMSGFFRAKCESSDTAVTDAGACRDVYLLATQFEPCFARSAFPCFDEPDLKATFDLQLEVPQNLTALSNMPVKHVKPLSGAKCGWKQVCFEKTPRMSTYLLAWAIGDLEYVEAHTDQLHGNKPIQVRVYTPPGLSKYAQAALETACKVLDLYKDLFQIDYPIPKSDQLVVPEFVSGAMENWGLCIYKPTKILFDPATSSNRVKSKSAYVIAHELAHQWFGNLVTMSNWSELWLNEGFATWAGYVAIDRLYPQWDIWSQFVAEIRDDVLKLDSLPTTHAIETDVQNENEALQIFDDISYFKGCLIVRMLAQYVGESTFFEGLAVYLKKHAYENAHSQDLWNAIGKVSGRDIAPLMQSWIHTQGFPVVQTDLLNDVVPLKQSSILAPGKNGELARWVIPLAESKIATDQLILEPRLPDLAPAENLSQFSPGLVGSFCIDYSPFQRNSILMEPSVYGSASISGLLTDLSTLALNGMKSTSDLLACIHQAKDSKHVFVWVSILRCLSFLRSTFSDDSAIERGLKVFTTTILDSIKGNLQWTDSARKCYRQAELDKVIIALASSVEDETVMRAVRLRFDQWAKSPGCSASLGPNLRGAILAAITSTGGNQKDFDAVRKTFGTDTTLDGKEVILAALGATNNPVLATELLDMTFATKSQVDLQHLHLVGRTLGHNNASRYVQWEYVKKNWQQVSKRLTANPTCRDWWLQESLRHFSDEKIGDDICAFFAQEPVLAAEIAKPLAYVRANISRNARFKADAREDILMYLQHGGHV